jgi:VWFA-related protein
MRLCLAMCALLAATRALAQYTETITVARVLVDARITWADGDPIRGLQPEDFDVEIAGKRTTVESVTWLDETDGASPTPVIQSREDGEGSQNTQSEVLREDATTLSSRASSEGPEREGRETPASSAARDTAPTRLFVVFVQTDFARNTVRLEGHMNFAPHAQRFIETLRPGDRVAVFSFDSHLKFRLDFTSDKEAVNAAIRDSVRIDHPPPPPLVHTPALASRLDREAMKRAVNSESALLLVANALLPIDGPKNLILIGWGLGESFGGLVMMRHEWIATRRALDASRTTVFAFDTTYADGHDLEFGLRTAAAETGGFYAKTNVFAKNGLERLQRTLTGRYELELRLPAALKPGTYALTLRVHRRGAEVLAPTSITVR